jgi:hypothetical protein
MRRPARPVLASGVPQPWFEQARLRDLADTIEGKPTTALGIAWLNALVSVRPWPLTPPLYRMLLAGSGLGISASSKFFAAAEGFQDFASMTGC